MATNGGTNISQGLGSSLAGVFVSLVLCGVSIVQTFLYYERYTKDTIMLKSLVALVFVLDTLHTFLVCSGVWEYLVVHFGDDTFLMDNYPPLLVSIAVTSTVAATVQSFFIYRIWLLTMSRFRWLFPAILMPFVFAELVSGVWYTVVLAGFETTVSSDFSPLLSTAANAGNGVAAAIDIIITISLCTLLAMTRTGYHTNTDRMLLRLIFISVNTGLSSALFALLSVIMLVLFPTDLIFTALYYPLCTVYCNTMLASLNARSFVRGGSDIRQLNPLSSLVWRDTIAVSTGSEVGGGIVSP